MALKAAKLNVAVAGNSEKRNGVISISKAINNSMAASAFSENDNEEISNERRQPAKASMAAWRHHGVMWQHHQPSAAMKMLNEKRKKIIENNHQRRGSKMSVAK
jgi:hypothetical protein